MSDNPCFKYSSLDKFSEEILLTVMKNGHAVVIVNYKDYLLFIENLTKKKINGINIFVDVETKDLFHEDIKIAELHDKNMMITVYNNAMIVGEPVLFPDKFIDSVYFIEEKIFDKAKFYNISSEPIVFEIAM